MKVYLALLVVLISSVSNAMSGSYEFDIPFVLAIGKSVEEHRQRTYSYVENGDTHENIVSYTTCREVLENPSVVRAKIDLKDDGKGHLVDEVTPYSSVKKGIKNEFVVSADYDIAVKEFVLTFQIRQDKAVLATMEMRYGHLPPPSVVKIPSRVNLSALLEVGAGPCSNSRMVVASEPL